MNTQIKKVLAGALFLFPLSLTATAAVAQGLVYVPLDGCRVMDTRIWDQADTTPVTGTPVPLPAKTAVDIYLWGSVAEIALQGGNEFGCPDVPVAEAYNVTLTIVPSGSDVGYASLIPWDLDYALWDNVTPTEVLTGVVPHMFREYDSGALFLRSSVINYESANLANSTTVSACDESNLPEATICEFDVRVFVLRDADVILDVLGYYVDPAL